MLSTSTGSASLIVAVESPLVSPEHLARRYIDRGQPLPAGYQCAPFSFRAIHDRCRVVDSGGVPRVDPPQRSSVVFHCSTPASPSAFEGHSRGIGGEDQQIALDHGRCGVSEERQDRAILGDQILLPAKLPVPDVQTVQDSLRAQDVHGRIVDRGCRLCVVGAVEGKLPDALSRIRLEAGDDDLPPVLAHRVQAIVPDDDAGMAEADVGLPQDAGSSGESFRIPRRLPGDTVAVGAAPAGPIIRLFGALVLRS